MHRMTKSSDSLISRAAGRAVLPWTKPLRSAVWLPGVCGALTVPQRTVCEGTRAEGRTWDDSTKGHTGRKVSGHGRCRQPGRCLRARPAYSVSMLHNGQTTRSNVVARACRVVRQWLMSFEFVDPYKPGRALQCRMHRVVRHCAYAYDAAVGGFLSVTAHGSSGKTLILEVPAANTSSHSWGGGT